MSNQVVAAGRPAGAWSDPIFPQETALLNERYATFFGDVRAGTLRAVAMMNGGFLYESDSPLQDGYVPLLTVFFRVPTGKVAIVFPKFSDRIVHDGTTTERSVAIFGMGVVEREYLLAVINEYMEWLPESAPPPGSEWPHVRASRERGSRRIE